MNYNPIVSKTAEVLASATLPRSRRWRLLTVSQGRDPELTFSRLLANMRGHLEQRPSLRADANLEFSRIPQGKI